MGSWCERMNVIRNCFLHVVDYTDMCIDCSTHLCIGRVVGGEVTQWTVQNEIRHFQHDLLNRVELKEPPPPYPVGRTLIINASCLLASIILRTVY